MTSLRRLACRICRLAARLAPPACGASPEIWCRPATVLALRDPRRAGASLQGWR